MHNERSFARRALARVYGNTVNSYLLPKCVLGRSRLRASSPALSGVLFNRSIGGLIQMRNTHYTHRYTYNSQG